MKVSVSTIATTLGDALALAHALAPLVQRQAAGQVVTQEDVDQSLAQVDAELSRFDDTIARKSK